MCVLVSIDTMCVTVSPYLLSCLFRQFKVNMWTRCDLCVFSQLHLRVFIIPDAASHPAQADFFPNSPELTKTMQADSETGTGTCQHPATEVMSHCI